jgi:hypothetical protein
VRNRTLRRSFLPLLLQGNGAFEGADNGVVQMELRNISV